MPDNRYFLAFDFGTESVRGGLFEPGGKMVYTAAREYGTRFPRSGWAEQSPEEWWRCFLEAARDIAGRSGVSPGDIAAMAVDTTSCTVLALDREFRPVRDALLWMDVRAYEQAKRIAGAGHDILRYNGFGSVSAEWMPCKALWLKENEPDTWERARYVCEFQDFINHKLTGRYAGSINNTTVRWYYDPYQGWPADFYEKIGLSDVIEKYPPEILELGKPVGTLLPGVAEETGLDPGTLVVQGGADAYIGIIGLGAVKPGRMAFITGSSHLMLGHTDKGFYQEGIFGAFPECVMPGLYVVEGAQISSGSVLKWLTRQLVGGGYREEAEKQGLELYDYLNRLAADLPIGSEGLILVNYWQGNRNPLVDYQARGVVWGLSLTHTPVHLYRAVLEGVSYGTEHIMRYFAKAGFTAREIFACGGATRSELWMQIQSDVLGTPIYLTEEPNAPLLGDAILASVGSGFYGSIEEAAGNMVKISKEITPDLENTEKYRFYVDKYIQTYPRLKELMHDMVRRQHSR
ncbi:MAG: FGGY-family carbohydrate kinase [Spirochaetota bacterium]